MGNTAFLPIAPEVILLLGAVLVLMAEVTLKAGRRAWGGLAAISLVAAAAFSWLQWLKVDDLVAEGSSQLFFSMDVPGATRLPMVVMDYFSAFGGMAIFSVAALALLAAWPLIAGLGSRGAEFTALALLAIAGLHMMTMSANLILLFMGLETASIALYVIAGFTRNHLRSDEAATKYFLLGSFASALFLYGVALVFAATGSTSLYGAGGINEFLANNVLTSNGILLAGIGLVIVGLGFKVSAAPFHQWAPDVYQGAPGGAVPLMSAGVKVAGFAALARILVGGLHGMQPDWAPALALIAAISVAIGIGFAIAQTDLKRMLAYSGVAHAGFILTGLVAGVDGVPAMWFYVATYAVQLVGAFTVAAVLSGPKGGPTSFDELRGLATRSPSLAAMLALFMLAMGGIPLTAGFVGKVGVFGAAIDAGYEWLAIFALVAAVAGLYFYLRVIVLMYFQEPVVAEAPGTLQAPPEPSATAATVLGIAAAITIVFGLVPWPLLDAVRLALPLPF